MGKKIEENKRSITDNLIIDNDYYNYAIQTIQKVKKSTL